MESAYTLDKACLRRLKGVRRTLGQGKVSSGSPLAASYSGLTIIEKLGIQILKYQVSPRKERMSVFDLREGIWSTVGFFVLRY
jgi:hypothetical protein